MTEDAVDFATVFPECELGTDISEPLRALPRAFQDLIVESERESVKDAEYLAILPYLSQAILARAHAALLGSPSAFTQLKTLDKLRSDCVSEWEQSQWQDGSEELLSPLGEQRSATSGHTPAVTLADEIEEVEDDFAQEMNDRVQEIENELANDTPPAPLFGSPSKELVSTTAPAKDHMSRTDGKLWQSSDKRFMDPSLTLQPLYRSCLGLTMLR
ncbi:hypothetical protein CYMTET_43462 [Cymbomonas tetramitiformis]|uniref:Uncharacterized protein n=1 Tax=Cymbomonas tetramitiformis TaxID=36881 RepID=A0AAE0F0I8_9CHLO|nr:hypothetical protein CYMTET_43462 [Cymbomonas tetramitiformis]